MSTVPDSQPPKPSPDKSLPHDEPHQRLDNPNSATAGVMPPSSSLLSVEHRLKRPKLNKPSAFRDLDVHPDPTPKTFQPRVPSPGTSILQAVELRSVDAASLDLPPRRCDTIDDRDSPVAKRPSDHNEGGPSSLTLAFHLTKIE